MNLRLKGKIVENYRTQADFAQAVGMDDSLVSKVVCGRRTLPVEKQEKWAALLGDNPQRLFNKNA
jgi:transcriptional regulator with XRE-family HTH domain